MIETIVRQSTTGTTREARIVCDRCGVDTKRLPLDARGLDGIRALTGFAEERIGWTDKAPKIVGDRPVYDVCVMCQRGTGETKQ